MHSAIKRTFGSCTCVSRCVRKSGAECVKANEKLRTRIMRRIIVPPMMDPRGGRGCLKFITGPPVHRRRKSDYGNRFILTGARDPTKTRPALNPLWARIETPHLLATTDAFTATDYRSLGRERERKGGALLHAYETCHVLHRFITFHNVFRCTDHRDESRSFSF